MWMYPTSHKLRNILSTMRAGVAAPLASSAVSAMPSAAASCFCDNQARGTLARMVARYLSAKWSNIAGRSAGDDPASSRLMSVVSGASAVSSPAANTCSRARHRNAFYLAKTPHINGSTELLVLFVWSTSADQDQRITGASPVRTIASALSHLWVARQHLFNQCASRPGHANNEDCCAVLQP
jgi:hypothetical protein